jgi:elongation factor P
MKDLRMKLAQEIRTGNVIMLNGNPMVVQKAEYSKSGRNAAVVKMKLKNLLSNGGTETVFRADDRLDDVILEHKDCTYSYYGDPLYVFMDEEFNQYEIEKDNMGDVLNYLIDGMEDVCQVTFYNGKAISVELPITIVREVEYTEPAVKGDTSGKVVKPARLAGTGYEISVPDFVNIGDKIEIDTRTNEFKKRV